MNWTTIRLELAAAPDFPSGSVSRGYLIRLPLDENGSVDAAALSQAPQRATVRRFWSTDPDESGCVGSVGDESLTLELNGSRVLAVRPSSFKTGGGVALIGSDGSSLPFRVASIRQVAKTEQRL